jgi:hypothetical protein
MGLSAGSAASLHSLLRLLHLSCHQEQMALLEDRPDGIGMTLTASCHGLRDILFGVGGSLAEFARAEEV